MSRRRVPLVERLRVKNVALICEGFSACLTAFEEWRGFSGPSLHFYYRTLERRRAVPFDELAIDDRFLDCAYAALVSWGMHRMGPRGAKLAEFDTFSKTVGAFVRGARELADVSILDIDSVRLEATVAQLAPLLDTPGVMDSASLIVGNSKLLHFLLPELVPPIDRTYTLRAFFGNSNPPAGYPTSEVFRVVFGACAVIASRSGDAIRDAMRRRRYLSTSAAKVIDNAVVGFTRLTRAGGHRPVTS